MYAGGLCGEGWDGAAGGGFYIPYWTGSWDGQGPGPYHVLRGNITFTLRECKCNVFAFIQSDLQ